MGNSDREYIENVARTLMGQLGIDSGNVGVDLYCFDVISLGVREDVFVRVFQDIRHMKLETLARIAACGIAGVKGDQNNDPSWSLLHEGKALCTMSHVHGWKQDWLDRVKGQNPHVVVRHMAASAIVAAMYDITVCERRKKDLVAV